FVDTLLARSKHALTSRQSEKKHLLLSQGLFDCVVPRSHFFQQWPKIIEEGTLPTKRLNYYHRAVVRNFDAKINRFDICDVFHVSWLAGCNSSSWLHGGRNLEV